MIGVAAILVAQISAGAIVARVKLQELRIEDLQASALLEITTGGEVKTRRFALSMKREGVNYRAIIALEEPRARVVEALVKCGAFDSIAPELGESRYIGDIAQARAQMFAAIPTAA